MNIHKINATLHLLLLLVFLAACATAFFNAPLTVTVGLFGVLLGLACASLLLSLHLGKAGNALQRWINAG
jgi:hypothetical protein